MEVPVNDEKVMSIFTGTAALGITPSQIGGEDTGVLGLPEFGPGYVRNVIKKVRPTTVTQLIKLCGMVHGTGTWMDNAEELIETGTAPFDECIGNRDDVMLYLLAHGCEPGTAYTIMEAVRKGRGISADMQSEMQKLGVPDWYIGSCRKIRYLFPKAHAASYVKMALTIAWYKVYFPAEFYAAWCIRNGVSDGWEKELASSEFTKARIEEYESAKGTFGNDSGLERLYVIREMHARGITPGI